jgi:hypothetical protein
VQARHRVIAGRLDLAAAAGELTEGDLAGMDRFLGEP